MLSLQFKQLKQPVTGHDNRKNFKNHFQKDTLRSYTQYSRLIAVFYSFSSFLLSTDAQSTDTSLEDSTAQMHSSTRSTLCSSAVTISLYCAITTCSPLHATRGLAVTTVHPSAGLKYCLLHFWILLLSSSQRWLPLTRSFCPFLIGEVSGIQGLLPSVTLFYGFFGQLSFYRECASSIILVGLMPPPPLPLAFIIYALIRWVKIVRMHRNRVSLTSFWGWKMLQTCWSLFGTIFIDFSLWHRWVLYTFLVQIL